MDICYRRDSDLLDAITKLGTVNKHFIPGSYELLEEVEAKYSTLLNWYGYLTWCFLKMHIARLEEHESYHFLQEALEQSGHLIRYDWYDRRVCYLNVNYWKLICIIGKILDINIMRDLDYQFIRY